jgi:hypothetical protein
VLGCQNVADTEQVFDDRHRAKTDTEKVEKRTHICSSPTRDRDLTLLSKYIMGLLSCVLMATGSEVSDGVVGLELRLFVDASGLVAELATRLYWRE